MKAYGLTASAGTFLSSSENLVVAEMGGLLATIDMGRIVGGGSAVPLSRGSWVPISHIVAWAEAYLRTKWHLDPSNRLVTMHQRYRQTDRTTVL